MTIAINKNIARGLNTMGYWVATLFAVTLDNAYPTGGYTILAGTLKLGVIEFINDMVLRNATTGAIVARYNYATGKLQCFWVGGSAGAAATLTVIGGQAPGIGLQVTPDSNAGILGKTTAGNITLNTTLGAAAGSTLVEVDNGVDLSAYTGRGLAFGKG